jgi:hypothetical protein
MPRHEENLLFHYPFVTRVCVAKRRFAARKDVSNYFCLAENMQHEKALIPTMLVGVCAFQAKKRARCSSSVLYFSLGTPDPDPDRAPPPFPQISGRIFRKTVIIWQNGTGPYFAPVFAADITSTRRGHQPDISRT